MDRRELRELFDRWAGRHKSAKRGGSPHTARYEDVLEAVVERAAVAAGQRVLDLGCGTGNLALRCLERGARVVGCDRSRNLLRQAAALLEDAAGLRLVLADDPFLAAPFADATFDAVVSAYALHLVPHADQPAAVAELLRLVRPGGCIAIGDLAFTDERAEAAALAAFDWLEPEPFARLDALRAVFAAAGVELRAERFTPVTWVFWARR